MYCKSDNEPILEDISLRRLERIILNHRRFYAGRAVEHDGWVQTETRSGSDYEGSFQDYIDLIAFTGRELRSRKEVWRVTITYSGTTGDVYDYIAKVAYDRSTAYKMRTSGPKRDVKFKLDRYQLGSPETHKRLYADLVKLERFFANLTEQTATISSWVASGMGVSVRCCSSMECAWLRDEAEISNEELSTIERKGLTLETVLAKLICKRCHERKATLLVPASVLAKALSKDNTQ